MPNARELAGLPGMPATERGVQLLADRENWPREKRVGRGGGWIYPLACLPESTRAALLIRSSAPAPTLQVVPSASEALWRLYEARPAKDKEKAAQRLRALQAVQQLAESGTSKSRAILVVADQLGEHPNTIRNWFARVAPHAPSDWLAALIPSHVGRQAEADCTPEAWDMIKADYLRPSRPAFSACYRRVAAAAEARGWTIPCERTLERRLKREIPRTARVLAREGAEAAQRLYPAQQRDRGHFRASEAVNADGHHFDVFVRWPDGTVGRPWMVAIQDLLSGKIVAWRLAESLNAHLVRLAFGDLVERYGIPDHAWLDNGREFASKWITGGMATRYRFKIREEEPLGLLTSLQIKVHWTTPYHGQSKPIERAFRDLCEDVAKHPRFEGAYTGNNPLAKPENYGSKAVPIAVFREILDQQIRAHNARPNRRSAVCAGVRSFDDVFAESYAGAFVHKATAEQRRRFLLAAEGVTADRGDGAIRLYGNRYWTEALAEFAGRRVIVRFDPDHLDEPISVYALDERFIGAAERIASVGFDDLDAAQRHARARRTWLKGQKLQLEAERRMSADAVADLLPAPPAEEPPQSKVIRPFRARAAAPHAAETAADRDQQFSKAVELLRQQKAKSVL